MKNMERRGERVFSVAIINDLLKHSTEIFQDLEHAYEQLPASRCKRKTICCSLMPEMTLLEALSAIQNICTMQTEEKLSVYKKIVRYFMFNPVQIITCPFLAGEECIIYRNRFFGCRAYGLWSREYYENISEQSRQAKMHIRTMWEKLQVCLPKEIIEFQVPYCTDVEPISQIEVHDDMILRVAETVENLSGQFSPWHHIFRETYFSDLSFLLASLVFGVHDAVSLKFIVVSDIVKKGTRTRIDNLIEKIPDIFQR
jgi:Fe-S-cluster containining protein